MKKIFRRLSQTGPLMFQGVFNLTGTNGLNTGSNSTLSGFFNSATSSLPALFNAIFTMAISAGAILAVIRIAYAGWLYMGSADMWGNKSRAKEIFRDAIIGLLLLLAIYLILRQIDPCLLDLNILRSLQNQTCTLQ